MIFAFLFVLILLTSIFLFTLPNMNMEKTQIKRNNKTILKGVEVAKNPLDLTKGLMFREKTDGMLLVFPTEGKHGIWMLFMKIPLDLVFIDKNNKIVDIIKNVQPMSLNLSTWKTYYPKENAKYCLEVNPGTELKIGDVLEF